MGGRLDNGLDTEIEEQVEGNKEMIPGFKL